MVDLVVKAGLAETLSGSCLFTVVAPDNESFAKLPTDLMATITGDVELLKRILLFHVVSGVAVMRKDIGYSYCGRVSSYCQFLPPVQVL